MSAERRLLSLLARSALLWALAITVGVGVIVIAIVLGGPDAISAAMLIAGTAFVVRRVAR